VPPAASYTPALFDLQLEFAHAVAARSGLRPTRALLEYTNLYIRFGLGRAFDPDHPGWRAYLAGLRTAEDPGEWTYRFYRRRADTVAAPALVATFGCFSYSAHGDRIRLHFHDADGDGVSPLAGERRERRRADLTALFAHVRQAQRGPLRVVGASWLYNLQAYRRLFPASYVVTARVLPDRFRHMPLWGQFVNRHGVVREPVAREFRERLRRAARVEELGGCFPFQVLTVEAPAAAFYELLRI